MSLREIIPEVAKLNCGNQGDRITPDGGTMPIPPCAANSGEKDWSNSGKLIRHHGAAPWNDLISLLETDKPKAKAYGSKRYNARSCTPLRDQMGIHSTVPGGRYPLKRVEVHIARYTTRPFTSSLLKGGRGRVPLYEALMLPKPTFSFCGGWEGKRSSQSNKCFRLDPQWPDVNMNTLYKRA